MANGNGQVRVDPTSSNIVGERNQDSKFSPEFVFNHGIVKQVINEEETGIVDRINAGKIRLKCEIDEQDKSGEIIEAVNTGSLYLVESYCEYWQGELYDKVEVKCTTGGVFGIAEVTAKFLGNSKLSGVTTTGIKITGGLQNIGNGLYLRWEGGPKNLGAMIADDQWFIKIKRNDLNESNSNVKDIRSYRGAREWR